MQETASKKKTGVVANFNIKLIQIFYGTSRWKNISQRLSIAHGILFKNALANWYVRCVISSNQVIPVIREFNKTENHRDNWWWICFMN